MELTQVASYDNYLLANMTLGMLQENGINCHLKDENIVTIDPLLNPAVGGIKLMVVSEQADEAKGYMDAAERAYLATVPCPKCGQCTILPEETNDAPADFWGKLKNMAAYGQTAIYLKKYRCSSCNTLFDHMPSALES